MTYGELGKKVLEQAEEPLSVREIWERACEMAGKIPKNSFEIAIREDKKQFYVTNNKKNPFVIGSNLVKENFHHKKPQMLKKKMMMDRASVQTQPKNKKPLLMKRKKRICTNCL